MNHIRSRWAFGLMLFAVLLSFMLFYLSQFPVLDTAILSSKLAAFLEMLGIAEGNTEAHLKDPVYTAEGFYYSDWDLLGYLFGFSILLCLLSAVLATIDTKNHRDSSSFLLVVCSVCTGYTIWRVAFSEAARVLPL